MLRSGDAEGGFGDDGDMDGHVFFLEVSKWKNPVAPGGAWTRLTSSAVLAEEFPREVEVAVGSVGHYCYDVPGHV